MKVRVAVNWRYNARYRAAPCGSGCARNWAQPRPGHLPTVCNTYLSRSLIPYTDMERVLLEQRPVKLLIFGTKIYGKGSRQP